MHSLDRRVAWTAFLVGALSLGHELVLVRLLSFFLGNAMDFLAIPIALLGLAIGSMLRHFVLRGPAEQVLGRAAQLVLPLMAAGFVAFFAIANHWFAEIHVALATPPTEAVKVVIYALLFLPPYVAVGVVFSTLFDRYADRIGALYFWDLAGAAAGCVVAPLLLTTVGLVPTLIALLVGALGLLLLQRGPAWLSGAAIALTVALAAAGPVLFVERPAPQVLGRSILGGWRADRIVEVDARWNELARTALLRAEWDDNRRPVYAIVQDHGISNVTVDGYHPGPYDPELAKRVLHYGLAWQLGMAPDRVLVMFAGQGRDMLKFHELSQGQADVVGVEINRTVVAWNHHPALARHQLPAFHALPNIHLINEEGRDFLNHDTRTYDLIYVANNGAVNASRTGHTRKFLDTYEAMEAYLDRLDPDGLMIFVVQPLYDKLPALRELAQARYGAPLESMTYVFGDPRIATMDTLVFKPSGLTEDDARMLDKLVEQHGAKTLHRPQGPSVPRLREAYEAPVTVTDDHPFTHPIGWSGLRLLPDPTRYHDAPYVSGWVKAFTVVLFAGASFGVALVAGLAGGREQRVPGVWIGYLLLTGIGYMGVQIPLIAKTELLVGNPLYAVSINLAVFLVANAVGALLHDRGAVPSDPRALAIGVLLAVGWGLLAATLANAWLLSLPLPVKALGVAVAVGPAGVVLGTFYPTCVRALLHTGHGRAVPMTYGLTTLSSVLGSALAMTAIVDLGFLRVTALGTIAYLLACALAARAAR